MRQTDERHESRSIVGALALTLGSALLLVGVVGERVLAAAHGTVAVMPWHSALLALIGLAYGIYLLWTGK